MRMVTDLRTNRYPWIQNSRTAHLMFRRGIINAPKRPTLSACRSFRAAAIRKWGRAVDARLACLDDLVYLCVYPRRDASPHDYAEIDAFLEHHAWSADEAIERAPRARQDEPLLIYLGASDVCVTTDDSNGGEETTNWIPPERFG